MNTPKPIPLIKEEPQPLIRKIPEGQKYPIEALGPLRAAVEAVQAMTQAPMAIPAGSALAVASLAVQGFANVETLGGLRPTSLYLLTIAQSGERKSSCDAPFISGVREFEKEQAKIRSVEFQSFQNKYALWKASRESIIRGKKPKGKLAIEPEVDMEALGPEPTPPPSTDRTVTEPTYEGLTRLFIEGSSSLGIFSDEGGQFLGGHGMNSDNRQKTLAALNDLWGGNPIRRTRQGDQPITLHDRRLAIHLMVQPSIAHQFMSDPLAVDTGFIARFLITEPNSTIGTRLYSNSKIDYFQISSFNLRLSSILNTPMQIDEKTGALKPKTLNLIPEARELLITYYNSIELKQSKSGNLKHITGTASKSAEQAVRIAGVLTLWTDVEAKVITFKTMEDAITLTKFYLSEALRLSEVSRISKEINLAEHLRNWLLEKWPHKHILPRDILRLGPNCLRDIKKVKVATTVLEEHGWLIKNNVGTILPDENGHEAARKVSWNIIRQ